ncbi:MAG TPA: hypothetical protein VNP92_03825, partial [Actinophytocola sp.]|nr:hypothetical protein [Actinophytocola sp.]
MTGSRSGDFGGSTGNGFADTDWFTPVSAPSAAATATAVLDEDFRAWRSEFPDFYEDGASGNLHDDLDGY